MRYFDLTERVLIFLNMMYFPSAKLSRGII